MEKLERISKIKREALNSAQYFQSLLEAAYSATLLSDGELEQIQFDCLGLLAKKTERFQGGDSSSIPIESAQNLLTSILFTIGVAMKTYPSPDDAVAAVQRMGVEAVFAEGRKRVDRRIGQAKLFHRSLVQHLLETKNVFYSATVVDGINGFFKLYDAEYGAQEIHITADYPVYNKSEQLLGIEFILQYLEQLHCENLFCTHFSQEEIHHLLCGYDRHYDNLLLNIYEPVLAAALGRILAGVPANSLAVTPEMQGFLLHQFMGKDSTEIGEMLQNALTRLAESLSFSDKLTAYVQQSLPLLAATIETAVKTGSLARVFLAAVYPEDNPRLTMSFGEKMEDERYCKVLEEFMACESLPGKIHIMKNQIHSLADLEDLLLDGELIADEIAVILKSLSPVEVVALMKKYRPSYELSFAELRDREKVLNEGLNEFAASLPPEQQAVLEKAVQALAVEGFEE